MARKTPKLWAITQRFWLRGLTQIAGRKGLSRVGFPFPAEGSP